MRKTIRSAFVERMVFLLVKARPQALMNAALLAAAARFFELLFGHLFQSIRNAYAHGAFKDVEGDQIAKLFAHPKVKAVSRRTVIGICTSGVFAKDYGEVSFMDDNRAKWSYTEPTVGRTPKSGKEITMDTKALALLGVTPELGAEITLTYTLTDKNQLGRDVTDTFTLVGWWEYDELLYTLGSRLVSGLLPAAVNPLVGRFLENAYWFYSYRYTIAPVLLLVPIFDLLGYGIPAIMYRQASKQSVVERLREAEA